MSALSYRGDYQHSIQVNKSKNEPEDISLRNSNLTENHCPLIMIFNSLKVYSHAKKYYINKYIFDFF